MNDVKCTYCGAIGLEPGFILDSGEGSRGFTRWVEGALERGTFGGAKVFRRPHWKVDVFRCPQCRHLEMFAGERA
jgi:hypothetical protein